MVNYCRVLSCMNRRDRETDKRKSYYRLPTVIHKKGVVCENLTRERRRIWIECLHQDFSGKNLDNIRICSDHFVSGKPALLYDQRNPDWAPTLKLGYTKDSPLNLQSSLDCDKALKLDELKLKKEDDGLAQLHGRTHPEETDYSAAKERAMEKVMEYSKTWGNVANESGMKKKNAEPISFAPTFESPNKTPSRIFTDEQEVQLVECIKEADQLFNGLTNREARKIVYDFAVRFEINFCDPTWEVDGLAELGWFKKFVKRNPCFSVRKVNVRAFRKVSFTSSSIHHILSTVPKLMLANTNTGLKFTSKGNSVKHNGSHICHENNFCILPLSSSLIHVHNDKSTNISPVRQKWLYSKFPEKVLPGDLLHRVVYHFEGNENYEGSVNDTDGEGTAFVVEVDGELAHEKNKAFLIEVSKLEREKEDLCCEDSECKIKMEDESMSIKEDVNAFLKHEKGDFKKEREGPFVQGKNSIYIKEEGDLFIKEEKDEFIEESFVCSQYEMV